MKPYDPEVVQVTEKNIHSLGLEKKARIPEYDRWILDQFSHVLRGDVLDVACGKAVLVDEILEQAMTYTGIDHSRDLVASNRDRYSGDDRVRFREVDVTTDFRDEFDSKDSFATILALNILEHLEDDGVLVNRLVDLLEPGGHLVVQVPAHEALYGTTDRAVGHERRYGRNMLKNRVRENNLRLCSLTPMNMAGIIPWWIQGTLLRRRVDYFSVLSSWQIKVHRWVATAFRFLESWITPPVGISYVLIAEKGKGADGKSSG